MSVLAEAISVVIARATLERLYPGGVEGYQRDCPNATFCTDDHLTRVGFMFPRDVAAFVSSLGDLFGFRLVGPEDEFLDIAIVDQQTGPTRPCSWLEFGRTTDGTPNCWLIGTPVGELAVPADWSRAELEFLSFVPNEEMQSLLIEKAGVFDQSLDPDTGKTRYVGRPFADLHEAEDLYRRAKQLEETGELVEASHLYDRALQIRPVDRAQRDPEVR